MKSIMNAVFSHWAGVGLNLYMIIMNCLDIITGTGHWYSHLIIALFIFFLVKDIRAIYNGQQRDWSLPSRNRKAQRG